MNYKIIKGITKVSKCHLMRFDGNAKPNPGNISSGIILYSPDTRTILYEYGLYKEAKLNNNESECVCLIKGLEYSLQHNIFNLVIEGDSQFALDIISKKPKGPYTTYYKDIQILIDIFDTIIIKHIPRKENSIADNIARKAYELKQNFVTEYF